MRWRVDLINDDVNLACVVVHVLRTHCALPEQDATRLTADVHTRGRAEVAAFADQGSAEQLAVTLQRRGLGVAVRHDG
ncbi:ATP-dependent Clp protease adaptor ClpS [Actinokineospora sp. HUAS TT18]|uniref:ATP-dependent Clp protease adaptor ClpS n=1 Tax=Actinokineospora sp. HUAS TT18 TaxID=3447451 RepID=UPI003F520AD5